MKMIACVLVPLLGVLNCEAREASDSADLAFGYANAFGCMGKSTVCIAYSNAGQSEIIRDVKEIKSFGGVLLIKVYNGDQQVLDAGRVIKITEK
jgi:hypothetical protein